MHSYQSYCAYFLAEKGYKPTIFEKSDMPGGMLTYGIPSYKLEKDLIQAEIDVIKAMGVEIKCGVEVGKDVTIKCSSHEKRDKEFFHTINS